MAKETDDEFDAPDVEPNAISPEVAEMTPTFMVDKGKYFRLIKYKPHGRQHLYHESNARFKVPVCGRRFGKSFMVGKDIQPTLMVPNKRVWIVGPTYDLAEKEFRVIWDDMIVKLGFGRHPKVKKAYNKKQGNMFIEFPWNTRVECRSAERPDTLVGESLDRVVLSEAAKHSKETWDRFIRPALSDKRGSADFGTTPEGMNWLHGLWQYGQNPDYVEFESWRYPSWENTITYPGGRNDAEIKLLERTMPREWFLQEIAAEFTSFMGKIYDEWDELTHVKPHKYNPLLPNYGCFDWGFVNPLAFIEFQVDSNQKVRVWREHYLPRVTLQDHIELLKHRENPPGYKLDLCFGDAADPGAIETVCANFSPCWGDPKSKDIWMEGVMLVKQFLKLQQVGENPDGTPIEEPWLTVDHSCTNTIREFNNYRAVQPGRNSAERNVREAAQQFDDHALDAIRYGMMHVFRLGANMRLADLIDASELKTDIPDSGFFTSNVRFS
jgi:hypothetical protein